MSARTTIYGDHTSGVKRLSRTKRTLGNQKQKLAEVGTNFGRPAYLVNRVVLWFSFAPDRLVLAFTHCSR